MALGSGLPGAKLETLPQRMPGSHMRLGRVTPALGEGVVLAEATGRSDSWAPGATGETQMLSVFSSLLPEVAGGDWVGHKEEPKDPPGFTEEESGRESRGHLFPRLQASGSRMGYREGLPSTSMQGCPSGLIPLGMGSRGSWLGAQWIEGLRDMFQDLHRASPWEFGGGRE